MIRVIWFESYISLWSPWQLHTASSLWHTQAKLQVTMETGVTVSRWVTDLKLWCPSLKLLNYSRSPLTRPAGVSSNITDGISKICHFTRQEDEFMGPTATDCNIEKHFLQQFWGEIDIVVFFFFLLLFFCSGVDFHSWAIALKMNHWSYYHKWTL